MSRDQRWPRNTAGILAHAAHRKAETVARADAAIDTLVRAQRPVTFLAVAKEARVTTAYLYKHPALRNRIEALRDQQQEQALRRGRTRGTARTPETKTDAAKDLLLLAQERHIRELQEEVRRLKHELQVALGRLYERI